MGKCAKCGMELNEELKCNSNSTLCKHCCKCDDCDSSDGSKCEPGSDCTC